MSNRSRLDAAHERLIGVLAASFISASRPTAADTLTYVKRRHPNATDADLLEAMERARQWVEKQAISLTAMLALAEGRASALREMEAATRRAGFVLVPANS